MRRFWILGTVAWLLVMPAFAKSAEPVDLIKGVTGEAITILKSTDTGSVERKSRLEELFRSTLDIPFLGRFVLGRYWRTLNEDERAAYMDAFERYVLTVYAGRLNEYSGESIVVTESRQVDAKDTIVSSRLERTNRAPVMIDWRVREDGGEARVIDVAVEGVSMVLTQRQEFTSILQREGVNGLIDRLKKSGPQDASIPG